MLSLVDLKALQNIGRPPPGKAKMIDPNTVQFEVQAKVDTRTPIPSQTLQLIDGSIGIGLSVIMIVSGIGLLRLQVWGRTLSLLYACLSILVRIVATIYHAFFVLPVMGQVRDEVVAGFRRPDMSPEEQFGLNFGSMIVTITMWAGLIVPFLVLTYPMLVLVIMNMKTTKRAFGLMPYDTDLDEQRAEDEPDTRFEPERRPQDGPP